jgi:hypothetical protein
MKKWSLTFGVLSLFLLSTNFAMGASASSFQQGSPDYDWWYGCSPTSAGMMMGYYDRNGYNGLRYDNLVPGGTAEDSTHSNPGALVNDTIASSGHIADFYSGGFGISGDDAPGPFHNFNSLADFMGTSQDSVGNSNGSTTFWSWDDGSRYHDYDALNRGRWESDGMYGIGEYIEYAGYSASLFTQRTDNLGLTYGFSFVDYMAEINAGRVVMIHVEGHSMYGYGYDAATQSIYLHDTWNEGQQSMAWGGTYDGRALWGVTALELSGGSPVPVPPAILLFVSGLLSFMGWSRRRQAT